MTEFHLKIDPVILREIYFEGGEQKYFFGPKTKKQSFLLVLSIAIYPFYFWYSINLDDDWIFVWGTVLLSLFTYNFIEVAKPIIKWRKSVEAFLAKAERIRFLKVRYDAENFWHIDDELELKTAWSAMNHAVINLRYITLFSNENSFLLPRECMQEAEFEALSVVIMGNVKEVRKDYATNFKNPTT